MSPFIFIIAILIMSVVIHEVSHGHMAGFLGDPTAKYSGRLTLNPLKHIDPVGSILVPIFAYFYMGVVFGWAKPVPYNPYNLRKGRLGEGLVAVAGPLSNLLIALIFGIFLRFSGAFSLTQSFLDIIGIIVVINIILAVFNLVPIPPLDGSKFLFALLPVNYGLILKRTLEQYSFLFLFLFIFFLWKFIVPVISFLFFIFTGQHFGL